jgi:hypothetical protein
MMRLLLGNGAAAMPELTPETLFTVLNFSVLPFWALLIFLPLTKVTDALVHSVFAPIVLGVVYSWLIATGLSGAIPLPEGAGMTSLAALAKLFSVQHLLIAGWAHYLVFDLFIGAWEARDAQRAGMNHFLLVPCLALTFLFGPVGLLLYLLVRGLTGRAGWSLFEG